MQFLKKNVIGKEDKLFNQDSKGLQEKKGNIIFKEKLETVNNSKIVIPFEDDDFIQCEKKFYSFLEMDIKRVKQDNQSLLTISSFNKITNFISKYVKNNLGN